MAKIKSMDVIADKWASETPMHSGDYEYGVKNPRRSWMTATKAAAGAWADGVSRAVADKRFEAGVAEAGDEKWERKTLTRGVANWGPGVREAAGEYAAGFAPYHAAISALTLPPRYARQDPRNLARVKAVVDAMIAKYKSLAKR